MQKEYKVFSKGKDYEGEGIYHIDKETLTVLEGSEIVEKEMPSYRKIYKASARTKDQLIEEGIIVNHQFTKNYTFDSIFQSASILSSHGTAGNKSWKTADGKTIEELRTSHGYRNKEFQWIPFYKELADKLSEYVERKDELFKRIKEFRSEYPLFNYLNFERKEWWGPRDYKIDPFSVIAVTNRGITDKNRKMIGELYREAFNMTTPVPESFEGIPVLNNMNSFYSDTKEQYLWDLFLEALKYSQTKEVTKELVDSFDAVREYSGNGLPMITIGLFWIRPNVFMPLDSNSDDYISEKYNIKVPSSEKDGEFYFNFLINLKEASGGRPFYKISHDAVLDKKLNELTDEDWLELLKNLSVFTENSLIAVKALLHHDGKATCTQLANKFGEEKNFYKVNIEKFAEKVGEEINKKVPEEDVLDESLSLVITREKAPKEVAGSHYWLLKEELKKALEKVDLSAYSIHSKGSVASQEVDFEKKVHFHSLYFEDAEILKNQIQTALKAGKDIILIGPPGTGKSKVAKAIAESYGVEHKMVTAMSDWSSYDTIGGYKPDDQGKLYFEEGIFLSSLKDKEKRQRNQWLLIDEINRADIDKAFGPFLSALSGDNIELGLKNQKGENIELLLEENFEDKSTFEDQQYVIGRDWRIIGTMNTFDKTSLYEMSYAFMRRFAFIPVPIPKKIDSHTVKELCKRWGMDSFEAHNEVAQLWEIINHYKKIGPAIVEDIAEFISLGGDYISSIVLYVLPQFEGLYDQRINEFFLKLKDLDFIYGEEKEVNLERLKIAIEDFFDIQLSEE